MGVVILMPVWEDAGVLPPEGSRNFIAGTKPKAKHFDALMTAIRGDHKTFADLLGKYGTAEFFTFDDMKTLVQTETGMPPNLAVVDRWPGWEFMHGEPETDLVEEVYIFPRLASTSGVIWLLWSTPDATGKKVVWGADVQGIAVGGSLETGGTIYSAVSTAIAQENVMNLTTIAFGPLGGNDMLLAIRLYRDGMSANDGDIVARLHSAGVLIA